MKIRLPYSLIVAAFLMVVSSCSPEGKTPKEDYLLKEAADTTTFGISKIKKIIYSFPSPNEIAMLLTETAGATFNEDYLVGVNKANDYTRIGEKAFLLGLMSTDMSYCGIYKQNQNALEYLKAVMDLSDELGISRAVTDSVAIRIETGFFKRDEVLHFFSETFMDSENFLKENQRGESLVPILAGGWLEGMYIGIQISKQSSILRGRMAEKLVDQSLSLYTLLSLAEDYRYDDYVNTMIKDLRELAPYFDAAHEAAKKGSIEKSKEYKELVEAVLDIRHAFLEGS